jgi:hypothetical protein
MVHLTVVLATHPWYSNSHAVLPLLLAAVLAGTPISGEYIVIYKPDVNDVASASAE